VYVDSRADKNKKVEYHYSSGAFSLLRYVDRIVDDRLTHAR
jgi:hypothetical protein